MEIYTYISRTTNYIHLFTISSIDDKGYAVIEKSLFQFATDNGGQKRMFVKPGEKIFVGKNNGPYTVHSAYEFLVDSVFDGGFNSMDFVNGTIYKNEL